MQKPLNNHQFALALWSRFLLTSRAGLLAGLTLLLLSGLANPAAAQNSFYKNSLTINGQRYFTIKGDDVLSRDFRSVSSLGTFDLSSNSSTPKELRINDASANTLNNEGFDVRSTQLLYRVYLSNTDPLALDSLPFTPLQLALQLEGGNNQAFSKTWYNNSTQPNLFATATGPGVYTLELYFQGELVNNADETLNSEILDNNGGNRYKTTFEITTNSPPPASWTGRGATPSWFDEANWSTNSVPNQFTDVTIPYVSGRTTIVEIGIPSLVASVRTLRLVGNRNQIGARLRLLGGELRVYGDFIDPNGGFSQSRTSIFSLAGVTQTFDGATFSNVQIEGGGTKTLTNRMDVVIRLEFIGRGGVLVTRSDNMVVYNVSMEDGSLVRGETESSYVLGILRTTKRTLNEGETNAFSGIGIDLKAEQGIPGGVLATRTTGFVYEGVGTSRSIGRSFSFSPDNPDPLTFTIAFHYRQGDLNLRSGNEQDLLLFSSEVGTIPFTNLDKTTLDPVNNVLTKTSINGSLGGVFTLGDRVNPLPVTIKSFTAEAQGANAVLSWVTAQEINSKGFEVQVSSDGKNFRTLEFVASASPNSSAPRSYRFRDAEAGKQGTRYYRLRQLDLDGKAQFIGPKSLTFGAPTVALVQAFPNPFGGEINLKLQTVASGQATVSVLDGVGRRVRTWQPTLQVGASDLQLPGLQALSRGLYVVEVRYQDGQVQRLKLMKE